VLGCHFLFTLEFKALKNAKMAGDGKQIESMLLKPFIWQQFRVSLYSIEISNL